MKLESTNLKIAIDKKIIIDGIDGRGGGDDERYVFADGICADGVAGRDFDGDPRGAVLPLPPST